MSDIQFGRAPAHRFDANARAPGHQSHHLVGVASPLRSMRSRHPRCCTCSCASASNLLTLLQNYFVCPPRAQADASSRQTRRQSFSALSPRPAWGVGEHEGRRRKGCRTDGSWQQEARTLTQQRGWDVQQQQTVIRRTHQARQAGQANLLCESILSLPRIEY